jgi:hypothetical protein
MARQRIALGALTPNRCAATRHKKPALNRANDTPEKVNG